MEQDNGEYFAIMIGIRRFNSRKIQIIAIKFLLNLSIIQENRLEYIDLLTFLKHQNFQMDP